MNLDLPALETSFDLVAPRGDELMDVFYARLFAAAPAVRPLFAGDDWRSEYAAAWATAYGIVSATMIEGAEGAERFAA
jgi:hemoglobin-like flavoprotein